MTYQNEKEQFGKVEALHAASPGAYQRNARLLALGGITFLLVMAVGSLAAIPLVLWGAALAGPAAAGAAGKGIFLMIIFLAATAWYTFKGLFQRTPEPKGITTSRQEMPEIYAVVDSVGKRLGVAPVDHVLLTMEFEAAVAQRPRWGFLGPTTNYLLLGLPCLLLMSGEDLEAVLAHEMAHLAGGHGKTGRWIFRLRNVWSNLAGLVERNFAFWPFCRWYLPFFIRYTTVGARQEEFECDATAASLVSAPRVAAMLVRYRLLAMGYLKLRRQWLADRVRESGEAPKNFSRSLIDQRAGICALSFTEENLRIIGKVRTELYDSHPAMRDRITALGEALTMPAPPKDVAADSLFGAKLESSLGMWDAAWSSAAGRAWAQEHKRLAEKAQVVEVIELAAAGGSPLALEERWQLATAVEELRGAEAAYAYYYEIVSADPSDVMARLALGRILLEQGNPEGVALVEYGAHQRPAVAGYCLQLLHQFHSRYGEESALDVLNEKLTTSAETAGQAARERSFHEPTDSWEAPALDERIVERLRACFVGDDYSGVLLRKKVRHFPEEPCHVLVAFTRARKPSTDLAGLLRAALVDIQPWTTNGDISYLIISHLMDSHAGAHYRRVAKKTKGALWFGNTPPSRWQELRPLWALLAIVLFGIAFGYLMRRARGG